jgi:photosystem II stability/assembly factor-like uncharacterized protein
MTRPGILALRICVFLSAVVFCCQGQQLSPSPCWIRDAASPKAGVSWLLCEEGKVLIAEDYGASWKLGPLRAQGLYKAIYALSGGRGFVVGESGRMRTTTDGGLNWSVVDTGTTEHLSGITFVGKEGWVVGGRGVILHSTDEGKTWKPQPSTVNNALEGVYFADARHGWAVGWSGTILRTVDGGATWKVTHTAGLSSTLNAVYFRDENNGWASGMYGVILQSKDGGQTWAPQASPSPGWLNSIIFSKTGHGFITADNELLTSDDGNKWRLAGITAPGFLERTLIWGDRLWIIGPHVVMESRDAGSTWQKVPSFDTFLNERIGPPVGLTTSTSPARRGS